MKYESDYQIPVADWEGFVDRRVSNGFVNERFKTRDVVGIVPEIVAGDEGMFDRREVLIELNPSVPQVLISSS